jgi:hypothetical protein
LVGESGEKVQTCRYEIGRPGGRSGGNCPVGIRRLERDERDARSSSRDWAQYNAAQKTQCAAFAALDRAPSYVELLTYLEMAKQAQELPPDSKADTVGRK